MFSICWNTNSQLVTQGNLYYADLLYRLDIKELFDEIKYQPLNSRMYILFMLTH